MNRVLRFPMSLLFAAIIATMVSCTTTEHVTVKPDEPVVTRPVSPGAGYVWRDGEWRYDGVKKVYVYDPPVWVSHSGVWVKGHWQQGKGGYHWVPGHWK